MCVGWGVCVECDLCATLKNPETRCFLIEALRGLAFLETPIRHDFVPALGFLLVQRGTEKISYYFKIDLIAGF